jgi:selenoprotein W-related protein
VRVTAELLKEFEPKLTSWELIPSGGGRFEVKVDNKLVYSKLATGRHPEMNELRKAIRSAL